MKNTLFIITALLLMVSAVSSQDWKQLNFPSNESITAISMLSPDSFFVVTSTGKIARTLDGGKNWVSNDFKTDISLEEIQFSDIFNGSLIINLSFFINSGPAYGYGYDRHAYGRHYRGHRGYERHRYGRHVYRRHSEERYYDRPYRRYGGHDGYSRGGIGRHGPPRPRLAPVKPGRGYAKGYRTYR